MSIIRQLLPLQRSQNSQTHVHHTKLFSSKCPDLWLCSRSPSRSSCQLTVCVLFSVTEPCRCRWERWFLIVWVASSLGLLSWTLSPASCSSTHGHSSVRQEYGRRTTVLKPGRKWKNGGIHESWINGAKTPERRYHVLITQAYSLRRTQYGL